MKALSLSDFPPDLGGSKIWARERKFSPGFSLISIFLPQPNSGKQQFSPYFPLSIFHPPYFDPKQAQP